MSGTNKVIDYKNVNGFNIVLNVETRNTSPISQRFTISYKNKEQKSSWPLKSLFLAIIFNVICLFYVRISFTTIIIIFIVMSFLIFFWVTHTVQSESLLVIPNVGMQSSVKFVIGSEDHYIPWSNIDDIIINEVIKLNRVLYYLTILVRTTNDPEPLLKLVPMFKYTKPRLVMLEEVYNQLQSLILESKGESNEFGCGDSSDVGN